MKIVSWNVNGIRAARKKSFNQFIEKTNPDIICIQEGKAQMRVLKEIDYTLSGYKMYWTEAKKAGYSGVAIWVKDEISVLSVKLNIGTTHFDDEGRTVIIELNDCFLINSYYPNGRDDLSRVDFKLEYSYEILKIAKELEKNKPVILTGDFNTAAGKPEAGALIEAVRAGKIRNVLTLLRAGADVNEQDKSLNTPLLWAAYKEQWKIMHLLLESGADLDVRNDQGVAAQDIALSLAQGNKGSYEEIYRILKEETETRRRLKAEAEIRQRLEREAEARQRLETFHETATLRQTILKSHLKRPVLKF